MATYNQWLRLFTEESELKRCYYLLGSERVLVEEIVDRIRERVDPHDFDYIYMSASDAKDRDIFAQLNQYPIDPLHHRLVIVRDAERVKKWDAVLPWLESRLIPQTIAVFIDNRDEVDTTTPHMARIVKSGRYVKCAPLNEDDAVAYLQARGDIEALIARHLYARVGGDLRAATDAMAKSALFKGQPDERVIDALTEPRPADDFVDTLLRLNKPAATAIIETIPQEDVSRIIGSLDYRLDMVQKMHRAIQRQHTMRDIMTSTKIPAFLVKDMFSYAKHYDRPRVRQCTASLVLVDSYMQAGATVGVLETLVATW